MEEIATVGHGYISDGGYKIIHKPGYPSADKKNRVREHVYIAEQVLGHVLPAEVVVHHVNGVKTENKHDNLVICQDTPYHRLLHKRASAFKACGHADWIKCCYCHQHDHPENIYSRKRKNDTSGREGSSCHKACARSYNAKRYRDRLRGKPGSGIDSITLSTGGKSVTLEAK